MNIESDAGVAGCQTIAVYNLSLNPTGHNSHHSLPVPEIDHALP